MRTLVVLAMLLSLSACSLPVFFRVPVVQGNVVTADNVQRLELGMTKKQVEYVMGTALVDTGFETNRWDYVFYYRDPRAHVRKSQLSLYFDNDKLADIEGDREYTRAILKGGDDAGLSGAPLPAEVTPGPNNEGPGDSAGIVPLNTESPGPRTEPAPQPTQPGPGGTRSPGPRGPLSAPLPGT